jgi:DNA-directed RNA polymerase specialized sigma24 family protein
MTSKNRSNAALRLVSSHQASADFDLDALTLRALEGDRAALDAIARELHPRLAHEARQVLASLGDHEDEAEDVAQDVFVAVLEGRIRAPRGRGEALAHLLRLTGVFARRRARDARRFHVLEE